MNQLHLEQPTTRFSGLAEVYARCRPDYPPAALDFIGQRCGLAVGDTVIDIGSGTGICSRLLAARGWRVLGVEPNEQMRVQAEKTPAPAGSLSPEYVAGTGEATGLPGGIAQAIISAQAFHWLDPVRALPEFMRLLRPQGWVALMWNERDPADGFTAAYSEVVRGSADGAKMEDSRRSAGQALLDSPLFQDGRRDVFFHSQTVDEEGLIGRALSVSYAPAAGPERDIFVTRLRRIFQEGQQQGQVALHYETAIYSAQCVFS